MRKVKRVLSCHFDEGRSGRFIARHCGMARRSVAQTLERFAASGLSWPQARDLDDEALEAALYPPKRDVSGSDVDWARVEEDLAGRGVTLFLLWEEWRTTHPEGMSYPTWCRRFQHERSRQDVTMRQNRLPGERLFVDYAGMTVPLTIDGEKHEAQLFVAAMGVSGRLYVEATLTQKVEDWCASHVRCFEDMGRIPRIVVPDNIKAAVIKPSRFEPVLNETYADLLTHYGTDALPARRRRPRDKALAENGVLHSYRRVLAPLRHHVFHDLATLNREIGILVDAANARPYADRSGETRNSRFESIDRPAMKPLPERRWQRTLWRKNKVHPDYHIAIDRHLYSVPHQYVGKQVDVRLRGPAIDIFLRGRKIAGHLRSDKGRTTTVKEHRPLNHQRAGIEETRERLEHQAQAIGPHVLAFITAIMKRTNNPELGFRSCYGVLRLAAGHEPERFDDACRYAMDLGTRSWRGLNTILSTNADRAGAEPESVAIDHANIRGPEAYT